MKSRSWVAASGALAIAAALAAVAPTASAKPAPSAAVTAPQHRAAGQAALMAGPSSKVTTVVVDAAARSPKVTATFNVTYTGFTTAAKSAFQRAVAVWATRITSSVPITIAASFEPLGPGVLGSAGPNFVWRNFSGAPTTDTWYVDALANKLHGSQLSSSADIVARFSSNFSNWHYGTGAAPSGTYDFTSVVAHEIGHGLGFLGAGNVNGSTGTVRLQSAIPKNPIIYDRFTESSVGKATTSFADNSTALKNVLVGGNLYFDSPAVRSANGNARARLYAPNPFQPGSSYSHLNEATYPPGNANSLMTPQIGDGETIRSPGAITLALFDTLGW